MDEALLRFLKQLEEDQPDFMFLGGVTIHTRTALGDTPLHVAVIRGEFPIVQLLLQAGAEADLPGEHGYTPLHEAVSRQQVEIARLLIGHGAQATRANAFGETPRQIAQREGQTEAFAFLWE